MIVKVDMVGIEPTMAYGRWLLRPACLPVAAHADIIFERRTQDLNLQAGITDQLLSGQLLHHLRDYGIKSAE